MDQVTQSKLTARRMLPAEGYDSLLGGELWEVYGEASDGYPDTVHGDTAALALARAQIEGISGRPVTT